MSSPHQVILDEVNSRRESQTVGLLRVFTLYRLVVSALLLLVVQQSDSSTRLGQLQPELFWNAIQAYATVNLAILIAANFLPGRLLTRNSVPVSIVAFDTFAIAWFSYLSGGIDGGMAPLLLVSVAAGAILTASRASIFVAAVASISLLFVESYLALAINANLDGVFLAGVYGALFFVTAFTIHSISKRLRESEVQSMTQAVELADLERVNRLIIQRMRTGILVVDGDNSIRMGNQSAYSLLGLRKSLVIEQSELPADQRVPLPERLLEHVQAWRKDTNYRARPFQTKTEAPEVRANFSAVRSDAAQAEVIVFLEDTSEIAQQAQQLKLAALGRLSASIAHEIRNPLGAITHAAQLLEESTNLDHGDTRLIDIITNHGKRMNRVIENILELSRRRSPEPSRLPLIDVLTEFKSQFCVAELEHAVIDIYVSPPSTEVRIDRSQLIQVLTNLAQNGLRYSLAHSNSLTLSLHGGVDSTTDRPFLNIIDDGPGVPPENRATLFEPFYTTEQAGTGLGLYIAREMCEANQARLSYIPIAERGACFRVTFAHPDRITV